MLVIAKSYFSNQQSINIKGSAKNLTIYLSTVLSKTMHGMYVLHYSCNCGVKHGSLFIHCFFWTYVLFIWEQKGNWFPAHLIICSNYHDSLMLILHSYLLILCKLPVRLAAKIKTWLLILTTCSLAINIFLSHHIQASTETLQFTNIRPSKVYFFVSTSMFFRSVWYIHCLHTQIIEGSDIKPMQRDLQVQPSDHLPMTEVFFWSLLQDHMLPQIMKKLIALSSFNMS